MRPLLATKADAQLLQGDGEINTSSQIKLERLSPEHADELFQLTDSNRSHLMKWLPWLNGIQGPSDTLTFIERTIRQYDSGRGPQYAIFSDNQLCGVAGFHDIDVGTGKGAIGYWLAESFTGQGIITETVRRILREGFDVYKLLTIEIHCATGNRSSRNIAARVGGRVDKIVKDAEWLYDHHVDHAVYVVEPTGQQ